MMFNVTIKNISAISWQSVLLVEETGGPRENHRPVASHWQTLSHNVVHLALIEIRISQTRSITNSAYDKIGLHYENITFLLSYKIKHVSMRVCVLKEYLGTKYIFLRCVQPDWGYFEWTKQIISINPYKLIQTFFFMILKNIFIFSK
jgi:hypothetical protein